MNRPNPTMSLCASRADIARWQQRTPAERLASSHYWRAKRLNGGKPNGFWTGRQWEWLCERADWCCAWCGKPTDVLVPDHVIALSHRGTNDLTNVVPSCSECNLRRGAKRVGEWTTYDNIVRIYRRLHPQAADDLFGPVDDEDEQAA